MKNLQRRLRKGFTGEITGKITEIMEKFTAEDCKTSRTLYKIVREWWAYHYTVYDFCNLM